MAEKLPYAKSFQSLVGYQKSVRLAKEVFETSKDFPDHEIYTLTNQIRRSSRSIGSQIAEAWAKRSYKKHFISKLTDATAELNETEHWIEIAYQCGYLSQVSYQELKDLSQEVGRILGGMIIKADRFCQTK